VLLGDWGQQVAGAPDGGDQHPLLARVSRVLVVPKPATVVPQMGMLRSTIQRTCYSTNVPAPADESATSNGEPGSSHIGS